MPELPEVEIIKRGLEKKIIGLKIQKIQVLSPKSFIGNPNLAEGQIVLKVWRRGKLLGMDLTPVILSERSSSSLSLRAHSLRVEDESKDLSRMRDPNELGDSSLVAQNDKRVILLFHLKMSGQLILIQNSKIKNQNDKSKFKNEERLIGGHPTEDMLGTMPNSHTRVVFSFSSGSHLYFNDQRKFGWVRVVDRQQVTGDSALKNLGPEPLEKGFTWQILKQNLSKHPKMPVKVAIMDQAVVAGVGNIYSNEACFNAKLDPRIKVAELGDKQFQALRSGIIKALKDGIKYGGSTRVHFVDPEGHKGYFLDYAFVYWRDKHPCKVCGTEIKKISLGGRGTYLCPRCQN